MEIREITLSEILEVRERRAMRQTELLNCYHLPLVSFTMNIAGPVKNNPDIRRGFRLGEARLYGQWTRIRAERVFEERVDAPSGCEGLYVVDAPAEELKRLAEEIEEYDALGRLFDMDVLPPDGRKLERRIPRRCLLCGGDAKACASRRIHSVPELQERTSQILRAALDRHDVERIARTACRALLYEVCVTPKPGLVDRENSGSHADMDIYTFLDSASALSPYFAECGRIGKETAQCEPTETFTRLRLPGKMAEIAMLSATGGVNAHKGAIFSMGLLCAALGRLDPTLWHSPGRVLSEIAHMVRGLSERDFAGLTPQSARTNGQRLYLQYGSTGVRGEAEAGFPSVLRDGLPTLERGLAAGKSSDEAGVAALLSMLVRGGDTNMTARGGREQYDAVCGRLKAQLDAEPYPDAGTLRAWDAEFQRRNLSPGGAADLLSICWALHFLREGD